jgi:hypothetical protein
MMEWSNIFNIILYVIDICSFVISILKIKQLARLIKEYKLIPKHKENDLQKNVSECYRVAKIAFIAVAIFSLSLYLTKI